MKRWPLRILLWLILLTGGAITTVAVAWGCALVPRFRTIEAWEGRRGLNRYESMLYHSLGSLRVVTMQRYASSAQRSDPLLRTRVLYFELCLAAMHHSTFRARPDRRSTIAPMVFPGPNTVIIEHRHGWPVSAVHCHIVQMYQSDAKTSNAIVLDALQEPNRLLFARVLPLRPIWPGFVINTLFYAAIWFGVFFCFTSAKALFRAKRGRCPRCGYDLRGDLAAGCSECGWRREQSQNAGVD